MRILWAFLRRDLINEMSYKLAFFLQLLSMLPSMLLFFFLSKLMGGVISGHAFVLVLCYREYPDIEWLCNADLMGRFFIAINACILLFEYFLFSFTGSHLECPGRDGDHLRVERVCDTRVADLAQSEAQAGAQANW